MTTKPLPSFKRPPVVETVLGVQFEPLRGFRNAHLGAFWKFLEACWKGPDDPWTTLDADWRGVSKVADATPLDAAFELFGERQTWGGVGPRLKISRDPSSRIQIRNASGDRMIQLQNGRLHYNWLGHHDSEYPRYSRVRPEFDLVFAQLRDFVSQEGLGEIEPNQWEITYVNHLLKGTVWNNPSQWVGVFASLPGITNYPGSMHLESFGGEWHWEIEPQRGRLHAKVVHGRSGQGENDELLRLTMTARGPIAREGGPGLSLEEGLDLGRELIVKTFVQITSQAAHEYWGLRDDNV